MLVTGAGGLPNHVWGMGSTQKERSSPAAALPLAQLSLPLAAHGAVTLWIWFLRSPWYGLVPKRAVPFCTPWRCRLGFVSRRGLPL